MTGMQNMQKSKCVNKCNDNKCFIVSMLAKRVGERGFFPVFFSQARSQVAKTNAASERATSLRVRVWACGTWHTYLQLIMPVAIKSERETCPRTTQTLCEIVGGKPRHSSHLALQSAATGRTRRQSTSSKKLEACGSSSLRVLVFFFLAARPFFAKETLLAKLGSAQEGRDNSTNNW